MAELNWSDAQWQKVNDTVTEAFQRASVASAFLPMYGPLSGSAEIVRNELVVRNKSTKPPTVSLDANHDGVNLKLVNVTVNVQLSSEQVAEETLSNALLAFRRAANILAQEEDRIVFDGFDRQRPKDERIYIANEGTLEPQNGLADPSARQNFKDLDTRPDTTGQAIVLAVVNAIGELEGRLHPAPFASVMGNKLFDEAHNPDKSSLVLPADRITPFLKGGPLLRSAKMEPGTGIVVSLAGNAVDIVVGTPPTVQFLQRTTEAKFVFRVYERFVLRIRDKDASPVAGFRITPTVETRVDEARRLEALAKAEAIEPNLKHKKAQVVMAEAIVTEKKEKLKKARK